MRTCCLWITLWGDFILCTYTDHVVTKCAKTLDHPVPGDETCIFVPQNGRIFTSEYLESTSIPRVAWISILNLLYADLKIFTWRTRDNYFKKMFSVADSPAICVRLEVPFPLVSLLVRVGCCEGHLFASGFWQTLILRLRSHCRIRQRPLQNRSRTNRALPSLTFIHHGP